MAKTILITGSTDGIGLATAQRLLEDGHRVLLHGRSEPKLQQAEAQLAPIGTVTCFNADLSDLSAVRTLAAEVVSNYSSLDVLINNAGVFATAQPTTASGLDIRFVVNTLAPVVLTDALLALVRPQGRVINLSSAAQAPVDLAAMQGRKVLTDNAAYAQSKLALTMWSRWQAQQWGEQGPIMVAVNPGSFLASKMVKDAYGVAGNDIGIGVDILVRAALSESFANAAGRYFDNDSGAFAQPHPDALDDAKCEALMTTINQLI
ncbi:SDR family NAD(P)-dependent oxidoreductase [Neiella sp. HB171785]|uniref:SDR family NAD(P)-dependent oxidoreductase n=1 Tax=Neiella litorisoli TaxID=2771431 RepID=A0A8J6QPZ3_9GAMM|nr:SDR family NAD(P)-dependent oxidoreductase [Neiella litorisoli]MBD1388986.1 SDR family NAD(P)-dependent oxidoreductase [Neiella litorisoli]